MCVVIIPWKDHSATGNVLLFDFAAPRAVAVSVQTTAMQLCNNVNYKLQGTDYMIIHGSWMPLVVNQHNVTTKQRIL